MPGVRLWPWWLLHSSLSLQAPDTLLQKPASASYLGFHFFLSCLYSRVQPPSFDLLPSCSQRAAHNPLSFEAMVLSCLNIKMWWTWTSHCKSSARIPVSTQRGEGQVQGLPLLPTSQNYSTGDKIINMGRDNGQHLLMFFQKPSAPSIYHSLSRK